MIARKIHRNSTSFLGVRSLVRAGMVDSFLTLLRNSVVILCCHSHRGFGSVMMLVSLSSPLRSPRSNWANRSWSKRQGRVSTKKASLFNQKVTDESFDFRIFCCLIRRILLVWRDVLSVSMYLTPAWGECGLESKAIVRREAVIGIGTGGNPYQFLSLVDVP
jgi:hypothetical protein